GRLWKAVGVLVPRARAVAQPVDWSAMLPASEAVVRLLASEGKSANAASFTVTKSAAGRFELGETDSWVAGQITARQVLFPLAPGLLVPAWSLVVFTEGSADWYAMV